MILKLGLATGWLDLLFKMLANDNISPKVSGLTQFKIQP